MQYKTTPINEITEEFFDSLNTHSMVYRFTETLNVKELKKFFSKYKLYGMSVEHYLRSIFQFTGASGPAIRALYDLKEIFRKFGMPSYVITPKIKFIIFAKFRVLKFKNHYPSYIKSDSYNPRDVKLIYFNDKLVALHIKTIVRKYSVYFTYHENSQYDYSCFYSQQSLKNCFMEYYKNGYLIKEIHDKTVTRYDELGNGMVCSMLGNAKPSKYLTSTSNITYNSNNDIVTEHYGSEVTTYDTLNEYDNKNDLIKTTTLGTGVSFHSTSSSVTAEFEYVYLNDRLHEIYITEEHTSNNHTKNIERKLIVLLFSEDTKTHEYEFR